MSEIKAGDKVTIRRGKHAGKTATVLDVSPTEYLIIQGVNASSNMFA